MVLQHYSIINNFNRLVRSQVPRSQHQHFFCYSCMRGFTTKELFKVHREISCKTSEAQLTIMQTIDPILNFKNIKKQLKSPFVACADFECILEEKIHKKINEIDNGDINKKTKYIRDMCLAVLLSKLHR